MDSLIEGVKDEQKQLQNDHYSAYL